MCLLPEDCWTTSTMEPMPTRSLVASEKSVIRALAISDSRRAFLARSMSWS